MNSIKRQKYMTQKARIHNVEKTALSINSARKTGQLHVKAKEGGTLHSQQKQDLELTVAQIMNSLLPNSDLN